MAVHGQRRADRTLRSDCLRSTKVFRSADPAQSLNHLEIFSNHTDVAAKREHRSAAAGGRSRARLDFPLPEYRNLPFALDTLYGRGACTAVISLDGGSEFRLLLPRDATARRLVAAPNFDKKLKDINEGPHEL